MAQRLVLMEDETGGLIQTVPGLSAWQPVNRWMTDSEGKRRPTDDQERDVQGRGLWARQVLVQLVNFGRTEASLAEVRCWSFGEPPEDGAAEVLKLMKDEAVEGL